MMPCKGSILSTVLLLSAQSFAQTITPTNDSSSVYSYSTSPRFTLNGTEFPGILDVAPLGPYAQIEHSAFLTISVSGHLLNVDASNANNLQAQDFAYISCDPGAYVGSNLGPNDVFRIAVNSPHANMIILYSETASYCAATGLNNLPAINGILTTVNASQASQVANLNLTEKSSGNVVLLPDLKSYTNTSGSAWGNSPSVTGSPTTAVAMIILYSITGIITALFVVIIVTGAVRAHRHPERYGPRLVPGRGRQGRARGIARAMLETLPIVKFGDRDDAQKPVENQDVEMQPASAETREAGNPAMVAPFEPNHAEGEKASTSESHLPAITKPDGRDEDGTLGCSICTEDFAKGEEVRVLPCNHKFHPACVDPWLLNVSGTCPLCRVDLRPKDLDSTEGEETVETTVQEGDVPQPLTDAGRRASVLHPSLRNLTAGSREERLAALRSLRQQIHREGNSSEPQDEEGRRGLTRRLRERFRIRTDRAVATNVAETSNSPVTAERS